MITIAQTSFTHVAKNEKKMHGSGPVSSYEHKGEPAATEMNGQVKNTSIPSLVSAIFVVGHDSRPTTVWYV